jgi:hypothetical protein
LRTGHADAVDLALEGAGVGGQPRRHERAAGPAGARRDLGGVDPDLGEHAADAPGLRVVAFLQRTEHRRLARFDPVEGRRQAREHAVDAAAGLERKSGGRKSGLEPRVTFRRCGERAGVVDRGGLERPRTRRLAARGWPDRAGGGRIGQCIERGGARFQGRLAAKDLVELMLVLLLVEELPARNPVDLRAQFGDAVLVAELHLRFARDQACQHVVAEGKKSVAVVTVQTAMITSVPTTTQKAIGPRRSWRPACTRV